MSLHTITQQITDIGQFIMDNNTYFDVFIPIAEQDDKNGIVNDSYKPIFPADEMGNYFYFRYPEMMMFDYQNSMMIASVGGSVGVTSKIILVACVRNADESILLQNLLNTMAKYCSANIRFLQMKTGVHVITQELSKIKPENIDSALQRMPNDMTFVTIHFAITTPVIFQSLTCISDPCRPCE